MNFTTSNERNVRPSRSYTTICRHKRYHRNVNWPPNWCVIVSFWCFVISLFRNHYHEPVVTRFGIKSVVHAEVNDVINQITNGCNVTQHSNFHSFVISRIAMRRNDMAHVTDPTEYSSGSYRVVKWIGHDVTSSKKVTITHYTVTHTHDVNVQILLSYLVSYFGVIVIFRRVTFGKPCTTRVITLVGTIDVITGQSKRVTVVIHANRRITDVYEHTVVVCKTWRNFCRLYHSDSEYQVRSNSTTTANKTRNWPITHYGRKVQAFAFFT